MRVKLWGVRGSIPTAMSTAEFRQKLLHVLQRDGQRIQNPKIDLQEIIDSLPDELQSVVGGETTCAEVSHDRTQLILDVGSGARRLAYEMERRKNSRDIHILVTHTHWDHIQGWPYLTPAHEAGRTVHFYSCLENLEERFIHQQKGEYSGRGFHDTPSHKIFHHIPPGSSFSIGPFEITTQPLLHPGGSISYKFKAGGKTFIFATDTEFYGPELSHNIQKYFDFFHDADLMIMDAQYSLEEAEQKRGWGHTAMTIAVDCCIHWKIKKLVLTHHEPAHEDTLTYDLYDKATQYKSGSRSLKHNLQVFIGRQDDTYIL